MVQLKTHFVDYVKGANTAGFVKVANAMMAYGIV
jgi:glutamate dehydrogenase/leucine dehydrogenase